MKTAVKSIFVFTIGIGMVAMFMLQTSTEITGGLQHKIISCESGISLRSQAKPESLRFGKVIRGREHVILYNSVPKCGSRTFQELSRRVFKRGAVAVTLDTLRSTASIRNNMFYKESYVKNLIAKANPPIYFQGHGLFVPCDKKPRPVYINFIRDPVSRMVSDFYFRRNGDGSAKITLQLTSDNENANQTIEECILGGYNECTRPRYPEIFCGFNPRCRSNLTWALERAKSNIDKYYTFIGITDDYEASLRVLEHLLPDMYSGATEIYSSLLNATSAIERSKTKNKKPLTQELNDTATKHLAVDYELYNYIYDKHRDLKVKFNID